MALQIEILSNENSWVNNYIPDLVEVLSHGGNKVAWIHSIDDLSSGDLCFLLGVETLVPRAVRERFKHNLVVHASALPRGKGWSPMTWQILEGSHSIALTLFEAADKVDSGAIYGQATIDLDGTELVDEWRKRQVGCTFELCSEFVQSYPASAERAKPQHGEETFYRRRDLSDSQLDPHKTIADQFDLLRVVDNKAYPAHFELRGCKYIVQITKWEN